MANHAFLPNCGDEDVIAFGSILHKTGRVKDYLKIALINEKVLSNTLQSELRIFSKGWFEDGVDCEILELGDKSWQKGKLKISVRVEFCPDEPEVTESPLDDIRQAIADEN